MKKKILSQLMILSFAFAGLFLVGNNLYGKPNKDNEYRSLTSRSNCAGQRGIERTDAAGNCFCLHDPEPDSGNTCGTADSLTPVGPRA